MTHKITKTSISITDPDGDDCRFTSHSSGRRVHVSTPPTGVNIVGSDLAALRDFINSLPEEAFVEPPPPWQEGDAVQYRGPYFSSIYTRLSNGEWSQIRLWLGGRVSSVVVNYYLDSDIDNMARLNIAEYSVLRRGGENV